jgi:hypothetical protein
MSNKLSITQMALPKVDTKITVKCFVTEIRLSQDRESGFTEISCLKSFMKAL